MTYAETDVSGTVRQLLGEHPDLDVSAPGALDNLDQFHIGGPDATDLLIGSLGLAEGDRVLDIGSGFGGPARQIARRTGNPVTGIDITPAYVYAARELSALLCIADDILDAHSREMVGRDVTRLVEPEQRDLGQYPALEGNRVGQHHVERR